MIERLSIKRIYEPSGGQDGFRVLVDRLWPRGISKARAGIDLWLREIAPSDELRRWYRHDHSKWEIFRSRYFAELDQIPEVVEKLRHLMAEHERVTLLFSTKELEYNNAVALKLYLEQLDSA